MKKSELPSDRSGSRIYYLDLESDRCAIIESTCFYGTVPALTAEFRRKLPSAVRTPLCLLAEKQDLGFWGLSLKVTLGHKFCEDELIYFLWLTWEGWNIIVDFSENQKEKLYVNSVL